jgi:hypothetical protein
MFKVFETGITMARHDDNTIRTDSKQHLRAPVLRKRHDQIATIIPCKNKTIDRKQLLEQNCILLINKWMNRYPTFQVLVLDLDM